MLKTVLFDLDGTLLDTEPDFTLILNQLLEQHDRDEISSKLVRETVSNGARALIKLGFDIEDNSPHFPYLLNNFLELYAKKIPDTQCSLFQNIIPLLQRIESENCQWGIVTNKPSRFTLPLLEKFPSLQSCAVVICPDHVSQAKPDPEGLLLACKKTACIPADAVYVGDHPRDIDAGINAKIATVAVSWGYYSDELPIDKWNADKIVTSPDELQAHLFD